MFVWKIIVRRTLEWHSKPNVIMPSLCAAIFVISFVQLEIGFHFIGHKQYIYACLLRGTGTVVKLINVLDVEHCC